MSPEDSATPHPAPPEPQSLEEFIRRGWMYHVHGDHIQAEADFRQAQTLDGGSAEAAYGLGLALKLQRKNEPAVQAFQKAKELIDGGALSYDASRGTMLRQLSSWHIQTIESGENVEPKPLESDL